MLTFNKEELSILKNQGKVTELENGRKVTVYDLFSETNELLLKFNNQGDSSQIETLKKLLELHLNKINNFGDREKFKALTGKLKQNLDRIRNGDVEKYLAERPLAIPCLEQLRLGNTGLALQILIPGPNTDIFLSTRSTQELLQALEQLSKEKELVFTICLDTLKPRQIELLQSAVATALAKQSDSENYPTKLIESKKKELQQSKTFYNEKLSPLNEIDEKIKIITECISKLKPATNGLDREQTNERYNQVNKAWIELKNLMEMRVVRDIPKPPPAELKDIPIPQRIFNCRNQLTQITKELLENAKKNGDDFFLTKEAFISFKQEISKEQKNVLISILRKDISDNDYIPQIATNNNLIPSRLLQHGNREWELPVKQASESQQDINQIIYWNTLLNWQISKINQMSKTSNKDIMNEILVAIDICNEISKIPKADSLLKDLNERKLIMFDKCLNIIETQLMSLESSNINFKEFETYLSPKLDEIKGMLELLKQSMEKSGENHTELKVKIDRRQLLENRYKNLEILKNLGTHIQKMPNLKNAEAIIKALKNPFQEPKLKIWQKLSSILPDTRLRIDLIKQATVHVEIFAGINECLGSPNTTHETIMQVIQGLDGLNNLEEISKLKKTGFRGLFTRTANQEVDAWLGILIAEKITIWNRVNQLFQLHKSQVKMPMEDLERIKNFEKYVSNQKRLNQQFLEKNNLPHKKQLLDKLGNVDRSASDPEKDALNSYVWMERIIQPGSRPEVQQDQLLKAEQKGEQPQPCSSSSTSHQVLEKENITDTAKFDM
jgi:hypothetical protein